jgi:ribosome-binding protein aMBF1 (putative translation factor)
MRLVDQSISIVRAAANRFGKKPLADRVGLSDSILRKVDSKDWSPTANTLRSLEEAASELEAIHGPEACPSHPEQLAQSPRGRAVRA